MNLKPPRLKVGDTLGIIAPAGTVSRMDLQPAVDILTERGFHIVCGPHVYDRDDYLAGEDAARLADLHAMFRNRHVNAIMCARGGYGTLRLIDTIDYDLIRNNPKIIVGYSDITALLCAIYQQTGLVTFHGPVIRELHRTRSADLECLVDCIMGLSSPRIDLRGATILAPGTAHGTLIGGNLTLITNLIGTPFMPSLVGALLFIEETGEALYRVDRMLTHLRLSGHLDSISALIAGKFENCSTQSSIESLLCKAVSHLHIPVMSGIPVGHGERNITLPMGVQVELNTDERFCTVVEASTAP